MIERAVLMSDGPEVLESHLPPEIKEASGAAAAPAPRAGGSEGALGNLRDTERDMIVQALRASHWNQSQAARALGISRDNLRYRVKKYNITRGEA